jgi:uncharacterized protein
MITRTFSFLPGIGEQKEKELWSNGIDSWNKFIESKEIKGFSSRVKIGYDAELRNAKNALYDNSSSYFADKLNSKHNWRLYDYYREETVFLDIETTGLSKYDYITMVGMYDGNESNIMVKGINLDGDEMAKYLSSKNLIVTFNGASFDLPMMRKKFPSLGEVFDNIPHVDLRHVCADLGLKSGLKKIEKKLGIKRNNFHVERLHGGDAVKLWHMWLNSKDRYYLDLLLEYNEEDIVNLKPIMEYCNKEMKKRILS